MEVAVFNKDDKLHETTTSTASSLKKIQSMM